MLNEIDLSRTDLNLLVLFETVLEERHVGRAAQRLNLSPSAVSHGLSRLRRILHDPLFLRTPKGVVPTDRALDLASPIFATLADLRAILSHAQPFQPKSSQRRFTIAAPDGVSAVILGPLIKRLAQLAPRLDIAVRQALPAAGQTDPTRAWAPVLADLDNRAADIAIMPIDQIAPRFHWRTIFEEDFVIASRRGRLPPGQVTLDQYIRLDHLVVSMEGDPHGFVDQILANKGLSRRIALTVPNFMFALAVIAESDLVSAIPRRLALAHAERFDISVVELPLAGPSFRLNAVATRPAMSDAGVAWLFEQLLG